ncbi:hypothetical protein BKA63DRAFT_176967 [Paraphoma chrysanthemicola]|nr:hypothetical protein BKA63DRAFT_176967 [Paraphoma chrysanthemicola]
MDSSAVGPSYLPWDTSVGNRFAHYSSKNHSAPIWVAAILGLIDTLGVLLLRAYIKRHVFGWDDYLITASTVAALAQFIFVYKTLDHELGIATSHGEDKIVAGTLIFWSRLLLLAALYLAKLSTLAILHRIFVRDQASLKLLCTSAFGIILTSGIGSILISAVACPSSGFFVDHCSGQITRWSIITGLDVATESILLFLPPYMVWQLQMRIENKLRVIAAFGFRLCVIVLSVLHLHAWISYTNGSPSPFSIARTLIYQQVLLTVSLITATIPNMKAFLQSLSARWGEADHRTYGNYGSGRIYGTGTYELKSMNSKQPHQPEGAVKRPYTEPIFEADGHATTRGASDRCSIDSTSGGSQDLIIRKETTWTVVRT